MRIQLLSTVAALGVIVSSGAANASAQAPTFDHIIATITHPTLGAIPPSPCATSPVVSSFQETTPATAIGTGSSGSFDVEIQSTCIASFVQAAMQGSTVSAQFAFMNGATPVMTYTLANAIIGREELLVQASGSASMPIVRVQIASPQVSVTYPKPKESTKSESPSVATVARVKAPAFQLRSIVAVPVTSGESWASGGVHGTMTLSTTTPASNATFAVNAFHVVIPGAIAWANTSSGYIPALAGAAVHPSTDLDFTKTVDASTNALKVAAGAHAQLQTATFTLLGSHGSNGITISAVLAKICLDQTSAPNETVALAGSMSITDAGSGRSVMFGSGMSANAHGRWGNVNPAPCS